MNLKKLISKSLSNYEISMLLNKKVNIVTYPELINYKTLDELLGPNEAVIILYETKKRSGHWTLLFKLDDNTVEHFDSYGIVPDDELEFIKESYRNISNQDIPYLSQLLYNSKYNIEYNEFPLQEKRKNINTCGRHVVVRLLYRDHDIYEYVNMLTNSTNNPDIFVTYFTNLMSNYKI